MRQKFILITVIFFVFIFAFAAVNMTIILVDSSAEIDLRWFPGTVHTYEEPAVDVEDLDINLADLEGLGKYAFLNVFNTPEADAYIIDGGVLFVVHDPILGKYVYFVQRPEFQVPTFGDVVSNTGNTLYGSMFVEGTQFTTVLYDRMWTQYDVLIIVGIAILFGILLEM